jgi:hypothetical protein
VFLFGFKSTARNKKRFAPRTNHASVAAINDNYCGVARRRLRHYVRTAMLSGVEEFLHSMSGSHRPVRPPHAPIEKPRGS